MLRISLALSVSLLTIGFPAGDAHAFKRLTSYGKYGSYQKNSAWGDYTKMLGEQYFKHGEGEGTGNPLVDDDIETLPYKVLKTYETFEQRYYPSAVFVCNKTMNIDTVADPFAGLENMSPFSVMSSKRWKRHHTSQMFMELFKYISGVNQNQEEMEMTSPVVTTHYVVKEDPEGNYEDQEMCFYLPSHYQENHKHEGEHEEDHEHEGEHEEDHEHDEDTVRESRHEQMTAPLPLDNNKVYLKTRPAMYVFARRFGGFPLTHDQWEKQRLALEADLLVGRLKYKSGEYMTTGYDSPWKQGKRRNEVWMQCLEETHTLPAPLKKSVQTTVY